MSKKVIILGASGHGKAVAETVLKSGAELLGFMDDRADLGFVYGHPILGNFNEIEKFKDQAEFVFGIGDNSVRKKISEQINVTWHTAIHPNAVIAEHCSIGEGTVVMANAVIQSDAMIQKHCIINTGSIVEHDNYLEDYVHVSPGAVLCGTVKIGTLTHVGAGAVIKNNIQICSNCVIGLGAVVVKNIVEPGVYFGVPAVKYEKTLD